MKILVIIPARKGSKRLKRKNILKLGNKPLAQITMEFAKKIKGIFDIIVSTDDIEVKKLAKKLKIKAPFDRPAFLSGDKASTSAACLHAINFYEKNYQSIDAILLLQPTSPFRSFKSIDDAIKIIKKEKSKSLVSVSKFELKPLTIIEKNKNHNSYLLKKPKKLFEINGNFYLIDKTLFLRKKKFFLKDTILFPLKEFKESIDIDNLNDFKIAKAFL